ncbi:MAG TPA: calcium-binding protein [Solirubrobacterales bacterium]|jgi:Ca2+-binding RTX toxin-like protein|nr:hypothetical protein [Solirubrobacterales bacterium]HMU27100.1 calcium-binding protein [Solirubrobacterales bacterium]HMX70724.1 calcium-binding protein [Solirubrobacterales bacterium]HNA24528.1 calcium-binding protein [Solirubrobacterales bacterium]HNA44930.1 calcium-binding protein [Solirubrobacterales bacterium]
MFEGKSAGRLVRILVLALALLVAAAGQLFLTARAEARPSSCFGKTVNRVVKSSNTTVHLAYRDVAWVEGTGVTVIGKPYSRICAGGGRQVIHAGKGTSFTDAGPGNDRIVLHPKSNDNQVHGGAGDDEIDGSSGNDFIYGSPRRLPSGVSDSDDLVGKGGNDHIYDYGGTGNQLRGLTGSDRLYSLGRAVSQVHGGNGTDFIFSNGGKSRSGVIEKVFGEQGNDRIRADRTPNNGPAYLDGGEGDDWMTGSKRDDIFIYNAGIKKLRGLGGDDLFVTTGRGLGRINGGGGTDTISFAALTSSNAYVPGMGPISGARVDLRTGRSIGYTTYRLSAIEDVIGSAFDDWIRGKSGTAHIDGGLGHNICSGGRELQNCNGNSPGGGNGSRAIVDINESGFPIVMGSRGADQVKVGFNGASSRFEVQVAGGAAVSGLCRRANSSGSRINCPANRNNLNGLTISTGDGGDSVKLLGSIPATMTTKIDGGNGRNVIQGGRSKDLIETSTSSAGSVLKGDGGLDIIYANDRVRVMGGGDTDISRVVNPCRGATLDGGPGTDSVVFAGPHARRGVKADLGRGYAQWRSGGCAARTDIGPDIEKLEGTDGNDYLIVGRRHRAQQGRSVIFGRGGVDLFDARNGRRDTVTTGANGHRNKVRADRIDKVIWGYGLAGY